MIKIKTGWELSINNLLFAKSQGYPIVKTSHIGNIGVPSLYSLSLGFEDVFWDITKTNHTSTKPCFKRSLFNGEKQIYQKNPHSDNSQLTCYSLEYGSSKSLANFHLAPLSKMNATTMASVILKHWENIEDVLCKLYTIEDTVFDFYIDEFGFLIKKKGNLNYFEKILSFKELMQEIYNQTYGIISTSKQKGGWLVSFNCMSVLLYLCKYWEKDCNTIYDLSGSKMVKYMNSDYINCSINAIYSLLLKNNTTIPREFNVNIIPTECWKLAYPKFLKNNLLSFYKMSKQKRDQMKCIKEYPRKEHTEISLETEVRILNELDFFSLLASNRFSQHDEIYDLILPEELMDYSFLKLNELYNSIKNSVHSYQKK